MRIYVGGIGLHVERAGKGRPLILLHGLGGNVDSIRPDFDHFSRLHDVVALDCRGHGLSDKPVHYTLDDHVADVLAVVDALNIAEFSVVGSSAGSYIAQGLGISAGRRIHKLALVVPKAHGTGSSSARFLDEHAEEVKGLTTDQQVRFMREHLLAPTTEEHRTAILRERERTSGYVLTDAEREAANRALRNFDFRPELPKITASTLVISGKYDPLNPPEFGGELATLIPDCRFELFEKSGHLPRFEEREHYLRVLGAFLES